MCTCIALPLQTVGVTLCQERMHRGIPKPRSRSSLRIGLPRNEKFGKESLFYATFAVVWATWAEWNARVRGGPKEWIITEVKRLIYQWAGKNYTNVSEKEDMEIERQLKILNKPPIKTIIMEPSYFVREENISKISSSSTKDSSVQINELHKEIMCPERTVHIRRTTKRELIFSSLIKRRRKTYSSNPMYHHYVSVETPYNEKKEYYGAKSSFGIHNPYVTRNQFSTSQMWIQNGPRDIINSTETGWAADGYKNTGCFNMFFPGFMQDKKSQNWWYYMGNDDKTPIGYWPKELFTYLPYGALVRFGGVAGAELNVPSPPMGNGHLPTDAYIMKETGFIRYLQILEENGGTSYFGNSAVNMYNSMIFGGPSGNCL
ncbi:uncharacterized protein LOC113316484 [Papaver somniferum]|uniref:uncharacterized protein LOC113316484 n=1 Tax=Papaver somniferum TaxID=3469 RepID=UPI000E700967|nr:uncharacterized protein LOC113316484 [Papaver somniferum]